MVELPADLAAQQQMAQLNVALSGIKKSAEADQAIANILQESIQTVPPSSRGSSVNIKA